MRPMHHMDAKRMMNILHTALVLASTILASCSSGNTARNQTDEAVLARFLEAPSDSTATQKSIKEETVRPPARTSESTLQVVDRISPGDSIAVAIWGYPEFSTRTIVRPSGTVVIPLLGELSVAGMSRAEFTALIKERVGQFVQGDVRLTVEVIPPAPIVIVVGAVSRPGSYTLTKETPLLDVIAAAGGWTPTADLRDVRIVRKAMSATSVSVDLVARLEGNELYLIPTVSPGDAVLVPQRTDFFAESAGFFAAVFGILILLGLVSGFQ